jgi:hypothetical protein
MSSFGTDYSLDTNTGFDLGFDLDTDFPLFPDLPASSAMDISMSHNWFHDGNAGIHVPLQANAFQNAFDIGQVAPIDLVDAGLLNQPHTPQSMSTSPLVRTLSSSNTLGSQSALSTGAVYNAVGVAGMPLKGFAEPRMQNLPPTPQSLSTTPMLRTLSNSSIPGSATTLSSGDLTSASYMTPGLQHSSSSFDDGAMTQLDVARSQTSCDESQSQSSSVLLRHSSRRSQQSANTHTSGDLADTSHMLTSLQQMSQPSGDATSMGHVLTNSPSSPQSLGGARGFGQLPASLQPVPQSSNIESSCSFVDLQGSLGSRSILTTTASSSNVARQSGDSRKPSSAIEHLVQATDLGSRNAQHVQDTRSRTSATEHVKQTVDALPGVNSHRRDSRASSDLSEHLVQSTGTILSNQVDRSSVVPTLPGRTTMTFANGDRQNRSAGLDYYAQVPADRQYTQSAGAHISASPSSLEFSLEGPIQTADSWTVIALWAVISFVLLLFGTRQSSSLAKSASANNIHGLSQRLIANRLTASLASWTLLALAVISNTSCRLRLKSSRLSAPCRPSNILCYFGLLRPARPTTSTHNPPSIQFRQHRQPTWNRTIVRKPWASLTALVRQSICQVTDRVGKSMGDRRVLL